MQETDFCKWWQILYKRPYCYLISSNYASWNIIIYFTWFCVKCAHRDLLGLANTTDRLKKKYEKEEYAASNFQIKVYMSA